MDEISSNELQLKINKLLNKAWDMKYSNLRAMFESATEAYNLSGKISYQIGKGRSLVIIGTYYCLVGDVNSCILNLNQALFIMKDYDDDIWKARALNMLGNYFSITGKYEASLRYYVEGISVLNKEHDLLTYLVLLNNISDLYYKAGNYNRASLYINKFINFAEKSNSDFLKLGLLTLSEINISTQNYNEALNNLYKVLKLLNPKADIHWLSICYIDLGTAYLGLNQLEHSYNYLIKALETCSLQEQIQPLVVVNIRLGEYFLKKTLYDKAEYYLTYAVNMAETPNLEKEIIEAYFLFADVYNATGNTEKEVFYYRKAVMLEKKHSSKELEDKINVVDLELKLEESKKDSEIYRLKNIELKHKSEELEKKNLELARTLQELQKTHEQLIQSEKMASLGLVVAAISDEINSPLETIRTSAGIITDCLSQLKEDIPDVLMSLSNDEKILFFKLISSPKAQQIKNSKQIADKFITSGIDDTAYKFSCLRQNCKNVESAVKQATEIVTALKKYVYSGR